MKTSALDLSNRRPFLPSLHLKKRRLIACSSLNQSHADNENPPSPARRIKVFPHPPLPLPHGGDFFDVLDRRKQLLLAFSIVTQRYAHGISNISEHPRYTCVTVI